MNQTVIVLDFGGQYSQLIARRIRDAQVYCEVLPWTTSAEAVLGRSPIGIVLSGGPSSVYEEGAPTMDPALLKAGIPVLGICYGCQLMMQLLGGDVEPGSADVSREYGRTRTRYLSGSPLFSGLPEEAFSWMSHGDYVRSLPEGFAVCAATAHCPNAGVFHSSEKLYGVQFHPEVQHTEYGSLILKNFLYGICGARGDWNMTDYASQAVRKIKEEVGTGRVLLALSGGVDSSVASVLLGKAIGKQLSCVYVDHGFMRKGESEAICRYFSSLDIDFRMVDARERFLKALAGVTEPEEKRRIIGAEFIRVFSEEAQKTGRTEYLAQGTIYPDVIESGGAGGAVIKSHHNVGGLPKEIGFKGILEPLRVLFKDEVRKLGRELGVPEEIVSRQPFPGPGLAIRVIGEVTPEKLEIVREADAIFREVLEAGGLKGQVDQYFAVLTDMRTVGVMGDARTYNRTVVLRAVCTEDFMTADFARIPYELLGEASARIINEVGGVGRVVYDISSKPPATVELE